MIIKSFTADSAAAVLKKVREEMGRDAIVLRTRQLPAGSGRKGIEITACIDKPTVGRMAAIIHDSPRPEPSLAESRPDRPVAGSFPDASRTENGPAEDVAVGPASRIKEVDRNLDRLLQPKLQTDPDRFGGFQEVYGCLEEADFPDGFIQSIMAAVVEEYDLSGDIKTLARRKLVERLSLLMLPGLSFKPGDRLLFLGPAGAGKSSVMGKLAARLVAQEKQKVNLASIDYCKMAAHDELASYAEILRIKVLDPVADLGHRGRGSDCITLIDSPALPTDPDKLAGLQQKIKQINPGYRFAVFSALTRSSDVEELAARMLPLGPTHVVVTMLDQTGRHGSAVAAAQALGARIAFVTDSSAGVGQVESPDPEAFARSAIGGLKTEVSLE